MIDRYAFITEITKEAGDRLLSWRQEKFTVSTKGKDFRDLVTSVDLAVDDLLRKQINQTFPTEAIYSEENKINLDKTDSFWTIDPIDGTSNFARNIPHFAVCLAYMEKGQPLAGAVYNPVTCELFSFKKKEGVFLNGQKISVSSVERVSEAYVLLHIGRRPEFLDRGLDLQRFLLASAKKNINLGSSALDLCFLAAGRLDAVIYGTLTTLDVAVAIGIVREAGGEVYTPEGMPAMLQPGPQQIIATSRHNLFLEIIKI